MRRNRRFEDESPYGCLGERIYDDVGVTEIGRRMRRCHADRPHATRLRRLEARGSVFDDDAQLRQHTHGTRGDEESFRVRLAVCGILLGDERLEVAADIERLNDHVEIRARRRCNDRLGDSFVV